MDNRYTALEWAMMEGGQDVPQAVIPAFSFIQELNEARLYKGADTLRGKSAEELARIAYLMIMMLEILRHEDNKYAQQYVKDTIAYENFDAMRSNATDLHNLLAVLNNQTKFENKITINPQIAVPVLQLKRYLRDLGAGRKEKSQDRQVLKVLENYFKISDSNYKEIRRDAGDWEMVSRAGKTAVRQHIKNYLSNMSQQNDIFTHFKIVAHRNEI
jgi:hypothetical protein